MKLYESYFCLNCNEHSDTHGECCGEIKETAYNYSEELCKELELVFNPLIPTHSIILDDDNTIFDDNGQFIGRAIAKDYDPTPWCVPCGAMEKKQCNCGPIAEND